MDGEVYAYVVLAVAAVVVVLTLSLMLKLFEWAKDRPLPGGQSRLFNVALVSLVSAVAVVLLLDIELIAIFPMIKDPLRTLLESIDLSASAIIAVALAILLLTFRRRKK